MARKPRYFFDTIWPDFRKLARDFPAKVVTATAFTPEQCRQLALSEPGFMETGQMAELIIGIDHDDIETTRTLRMVKRRPPKEGDIPMTYNPAALSALANGNIANAIQASRPGGIEAQEAEEQATLVNAFDTLPRDMGANGREIAERMGFVFGADVDDLFVSVTAPEGWTYRATSHAMHNEILDAHGRARGTVFYKGAFYDRRADGHWLLRYTVTTERTSPEGEGPETLALVVRDNATGQVMFRSAQVSATHRAMDHGTREWEDAYTAYTRGERDARAAATAYRDETYPNHADPLAYWDAD